MTIWYETGVAHWECQCCQLNSSRPNLTQGFIIAEEMRKVHDRPKRSKELSQQLKCDFKAISVDATSITTFNHVGIQNIMKGMQPDKFR